MAARIGVGIAGSGFVARFHVQSWRGVRDADITAIYSRNRKSAEELASLCRELRVGEPAVYEDLAAMVRDPAVDAVWVATPNDLRVRTAEIIAEEVRSGRAELTGVAFEKPLMTTVGPGPRWTGTPPTSSPPPSPEQHGRQQAVRIRLAATGQADQRHQT